MQVIKVKEGSTLTIQPEGRLDSNTADSFLQALEGEALEDLQSLIVDMEQVDYISSKGISALAMTHKRVAGGASFSVINANNAVREVLHLSGLDSRFSVS